VRAFVLLLVSSLLTLSCLAGDDAPPLKFRSGFDGMSVGFTGGAGNRAGIKGGNPDDGKQWLKVDAIYTVDAPLEYLPLVRFKIYMDVDSPKGKLSDTSNTTPALLYGEASYVNVPNALPGHELHVTFYLHPYTMHRFGGDKNFSRFDADRNIHIDAYVGDEKVDGRDYREVPAENAKWYLADGLPRISGFLLPQEQTGFNKNDVTYPQPQVKSAGE